METKADIRKRMLRLRSSLSKEQRQQAGIIIQHKVFERPEYQKASWIYLYMDYQSEVATDKLLEQSLRLGKRVAVPKVIGEEMEFYEITGLSDVTEGYKGIREPVTDRIIRENRAFMVVPGVAFSREQMRLGYGKGFYDRYLMRFPDIYTCGLAYECQVLDVLPTEEHDIPLRELITEGVIRG